MEAPAAAVVIPPGRVYSLRQLIERQIAADLANTPADQNVLDRVEATGYDLAEAVVTYSERLEVASLVGLFGLSSSLYEFIRDHEGALRAVRRAQQNARFADRSATIYALDRASYRIAKVEHMVTFGIATASGNAKAISKTQKAKHVYESIQVTRQIIQDERINLLQEWDRIPVEQLALNEVMNKGPDHNIDEFGFLEMDIVVAPPSTMNPTRNSVSALAEADVAISGKQTSGQDRAFCCICLESFTEAHQAFCISQCGHTIGRLCLATWLNSMAPNATKCPYCRRLLCERRPLQALPLLPIIYSSNISLPILSPQRSLIQHRLQWAVYLYFDLVRVVKKLWGNVASKSFMDDFIRDVNYGFFFNNMQFLLVGSVQEKDWQLRRVDWHAPTEV